MFDVKIRSLVVMFALSMTTMACGDDSEGHDDHDHDHEVGTPTGATCPEESTLTYETFGKTFMMTYCTRCHSSELTGAARNGAPSGHDFDTLAGIKAVSMHIDQLAASGPDSTNTEMPENGAQPTMEEREQLGEWLACDAP